MLIYIINLNNQEKWKIKTKDFVKTIADLKRSLVFSMDMWDMNLLMRDENCNYTLLEDSQTLEDYNIRKYSTLYLSPIRSCFNILLNEFSKICSQQNELKSNDRVVSLKMRLFEEGDSFIDCSIWCYSNVSISQMLDNRIWNCILQYKQFNERVRSEFHDKVLGKPPKVIFDHFLLRNTIDAIILLLQSKCNHPNRFDAIKLLYRYRMLHKLVLTKSVCSENDNEYGDIINLYNLDTILQKKGTIA